LIKSLFNDWTLFLDRDGVINQKIDGDYVRSWPQFRILPTSLPALKILSQTFKRLIIVTNQRGIAKGLMTQPNLDEIHQKMTLLFKEWGIHIDAIYVCPHEISENCNCRKPKIGLFEKAKQDFPDIEYGKSFVVGDSSSDWEAAQRIGAHPIAISSSNDYSFSAYANLLDYCSHLAELQLKTNH